jgi:hypothetical protein
LPKKGVPVSRIELSRTERPVGPDLGPALARYPANFA